MISPQPLGNETWISSSDMPLYIMNGRKDYAMGLRAVVRPDGKVRSCEVEYGSDDKDLDLYTCALLAKRRRFAAARWLDGSEVYGVRRIPFTWRRAWMPPIRLRPADLDITVNQLPKGVPSPVRVEVMFAADEKGNVVACAAEPNDKIDGKKYRLPAAIYTVACAELARSFNAVPATDEAGRLVRSVQNAIVRVTRDK